MRRPSTEPKSLAIDSWVLLLVHSDLRTTWRAEAPRRRFGVLWLASVSRQSHVDYVTQPQECSQDLQRKRSRARKSTARDGRISSVSYHLSWQNRRRTGLAGDARAGVDLVKKTSPNRCPKFRPDVGTLRSRPRTRRSFRPGGPPNAQH